MLCAAVSAAASTAIATAVTASAALTALTAEPVAATAATEATALATTARLGQRWFCREATAFAFAAAIAIAVIVLCCRECAGERAGGGRLCVRSVAAAAGARPPVEHLDAACARGHAACGARARECPYAVEGRRAEGANGQQEGSEATDEAA